MFENVSFGKWYFIFPYFTVCTVPHWHVIPLQTYQLTIVWKLLAKCKKSFFLLKRVYKVHKIFDVSSFSLRKSKWYPGMSSWRVISSVGFEENQDYENLATCNMRTSFQRHKFLVYLKRWDELCITLLLRRLFICHSYYHVYCKDSQAGNSRTLWQYFERGANFWISK